MERATLTSLLMLAGLLAGFVWTGAWAQSMEEHRTDAARAAVTTTPRGGSVEPSAVAADVVRRTNTFREHEGRGAVAWNAKLAATAQDFAEFMARTDRYGHDADGRRPSERAEKHGYDYCLVAENIAYQYRSTGFPRGELAEALVEGWWKYSPPHRRNMLDPDVVDTGVGVARSTTTGRWYGVQMFGLPQAAKMAFQVTNDANTSVEYRLGDRTFALPPRVTRTHEQCRPTHVTVDWPGEQPTTTVKPHGGERYIVVQGASGRWRIERE